MILICSLWALLIIGVCIAAFFECDCPDCNPQERDQ